MRSNIHSCMAELMYTVFLWLACDGIITISHFLPLFESSPEGIMLLS